MLCFNLTACTIPINILVLGRQSSSLAPDQWLHQVAPRRTNKHHQLVQFRLHQSERRYGDEDSGGRQQWGDGGEGEGGVGGGEGEGGDQQVRQQRDGERGEERGEGEVEEEPGSDNQGFTVQIYPLPITSLLLKVLDYRCEK